MSLTFYHQAYDPAVLLRRFHPTGPTTATLSDMMDIQRAHAEQELAIAFLFGRTLVLPFAHATDSPLFLDLFSRLYPAYRSYRRKIEPVFSQIGQKWQPLRVTLAPQFPNLISVAAKYQWTPARYVQFDGLPPHIQAARVERLCHYLVDGHYRDAAKLVGKDWMEDVYHDLVEYFDEFAAARPVRDAPTNFLELLNDRVLEIERDTAVKAEEIRAAISAMNDRLGKDDRVRRLGRTGEQIASAFRGVRWTRKTGQVAKRESPLEAAGWPKVRHGEYTEEA